MLVDVGFDGSPANNGICGGLANCSNGSQGLIPIRPPLTSSGPSVSGTGEFVAFASGSNNLVSGQKSTGSQIFLRDTCLSSTTSTTCVPATSLLSGAPAGGAANGQSSQPSVDSAGAHVAFTSLATNLITTPPVTTGTSQIYWTPSCTSAVSSTGAACNSTSTGHYGRGSCVCIRGRFERRQWKQLRSGDQLGRGVCCVRFARHEPGNFGYVD